MEWNGAKYQSGRVHGQLVLHSSFYPHWNPSTHCAMQAMAFPCFSDSASKMRGSTALKLDSKMARRSERCENGDSLLSPAITHCHFPSAKYKVPYHAKRAQ